jgi:hypothetical protein
MPLSCRTRASAGPGKAIHRFLDRLRAPAFRKPRVAWHGASSRLFPRGCRVREDACVASSPPDALAPPASPRMRRIVSRAVAAHLFLQIAVPAAYYLGEPAIDERFRWRMFSTRQYERESCTIAVFENDLAGAPAEEQRIQLHRLFSSATVGALGRQPLQVGEAVLRARCAASSRPGLVRLERICHPAEGSSPPPGEMTLRCATGELSVRDL